MRQKVAHLCNGADALELCLHFTWTSSLAEAFLMTSTDPPCVVLSGAIFGRSASAGADGFLLPVGRPCTGEAGLIVAFPVAAVE